MKKRTKVLTLCALFTAVICVCAQISLPMPSGIALTFQTFGIALAGFVLGARCGAVCSLAYIAIGALGIPVFSGFGGGVGALLGFSGGFLWCMPPFSALCGLAFYVNQKIYKFLIFAAAIVLLYAVGILWFSHFSGNGIFESFLTAGLIYLPKDTISLAIAYLTAKRIRKNI